MLPEVLVVGYFRGVLGTGEHGRQLVAALQTQDIPVQTETLRADVAPEEGGLTPPHPAGQASDPWAHVALLCVNADQVRYVVDHLGPRTLAKRHRIAFWAWEVAKFPEQFFEAFKGVDEVWVGSEHVRAAVAAVAPVPVVRIPQPVSLPDDAAMAAPPKGIPDGFRFLFAFDYLSVFQRKNPLAVIEAFRRAFSRGSDAVLLIKHLNAGHNPEAHKRLVAAATDSGIQLFGEVLSPSERNGLMNVADCYVSLHRAEGFGYTLAESMWLGKPVIATGYSGNLDFMTTQNSYLVDYRLIPIGLGCDPYPADGEWADPDIEHAAHLMRHVFENRDEARARGERAASEIRATHGLEAAGRAMRERLEEIQASRPGGVSGVLQRVLETISPVSRSR